MPMYKRPADAPEANLDDDEANAELTRQNPPADAQDENWKKRYSDLRSYSSKKETEFQEQITKLTKQVDQLQNSKNTASMPTTKEELQAWMDKYPEVAAVVKSIAMIEAEGQTSVIKDRLKEIDDERESTRKEKAQLELEKLHPDFFSSIANDEAFHEWLKDKSKATQDSIYENDLDYKWASETINMYKAETSHGKPKRDTSRNTRENAREVPSRGSNPNPGGQGKIWKESEIQAMPSRVFEQNYEEIEKAQKEGRIVMDLKDAKEAARG